MEDACVDSLVHYDECEANIIFRIDASQHFLDCCKFNIVDNINVTLADAVAIEENFLRKSSVFSPVEIKESHYNFK